MSDMKMFDKSNRAVKNSSLQGYVKGKLNRFRADEDGAMLVLTLFMFIFFLVMGGIGIDVMRHEARRTHIAAIADAASLAGASAANEAEAKAIIEDYFAKNGVSEYLQEFGEDDVDITLNASKVTVNAELTLDTYLMHLSGVETLSAAATSTAERRIPKLEIALVLDVSGSMSGSKLTNLKASAKEFVTSILESSDPGDAVISIVPFSFGVTPSDALFDALSVNVTHDYSNCVVFNDDDFGDTAIDPDTTYAQQIFTSRFDISGQFQTLNEEWTSCYTDDYFRVLPFSVSETDLHNKIDSLEANGNTSGDEGIKWAAGLLDPKFNEVTQALIAANEVAGSQATVPASFTEPDTQKVIVMMGDGENTQSHFFNDPNGLLDPDIAENHSQADFRGPESDLWRVDTTEQEFKLIYRRFNINARSTNPAFEYLCANEDEFVCEYENVDISTYYLYDAYGSITDRYRDLSEQEWLSPVEFEAIKLSAETAQNQAQADENADALASGRQPDELPPVVEQLSWEHAWGQMSPDFHRATIGSSIASNDYSFQEQVTGSDKNDRMDDSCTAIKGKNVVVYTIGFDVPEGGTAESELKKCASSDTRYFRTVNGSPTGADETTLNDAFNAIATNVQNLRLTQ